jgi:hypothetical protein
VSWTQKFSRACFGVQGCPPFPTLPGRKCDMTPDILTCPLSGRSKPYTHFWRLIRGVLSNRYELFRQESQKQGGYIGNRKMEEVPLTTLNSKGGSPVGTSPLRQGEFCGDKVGRNMGLPVGGRMITWDWLERIRIGNK